MTTLRDQINRLPDGGADFSLWCEEALGSGCGQAILATLCSIEHPMLSPDRGNERDTCIAIGRKEVIALLLMRSESEITPGRVPKPQESHAQA